MAGLLKKVFGLMSNSRVIIGIVVLIAFVAVGSVIYRMVSGESDPKFVPNAQYIGDGSGGASGPGGVGKIKVTMYGVSWCPHSKAAAKPWKEWSAANNGKSIAGVPIECETVDCEADDASEAKCQAAGVKGYPTVVAELPSGERAIMEAKTTVNSLTQFVTKMAQSVASGTSL